MAGQTKQVTFTTEELLTALIVAAGITEGKWMVAVTLSLSMQGGILLPDGRKSVGGIVAFNQMGIEMVLDGAPGMEGVPVVDAAVVNPKAKGMQN